MFKKEKIILAVGCSYTDPKFRSQCQGLSNEERGGWPMWPEIFKNRLEKETGKSYRVINLGRSGFGHDALFKRIITGLAEYGDSVEIILWGGTQFHRRLEPIHMRTYNSMAYSFMKTLYKGPDNQSDNSWLNFCEYSKYGTIGGEFTQPGMQNTIDMELGRFWTLLNICNSKKIKFLYYQLLTAFPGYSWICDVVKSWNQPTDKIKEYVCKTAWQNDYMLQTDFGKYIVKHKKSFLGFQMFGQEAWDRQSREEQDKFRIRTFHQLDEETKASWDKHAVASLKKIDGHPNAAGQEDIGNKVWNHYVHNLA